LRWLRPAVAAFDSLNRREQGPNALSEHVGFVERVRRRDERRLHFEAALKEHSAVEW
jgi:hypothetical protein